MIDITEVFEDYCSKIGGKAIRSRRICYFDKGDEILFFQFEKHATSRLYLTLWVGCEDKALSKLYAKSIGKPYQKLKYPAFKLVLPDFTKHIVGGRELYKAYLGNNFINGMWMYKRKSYIDLNIKQMTEISKYIIKYFKEDKIDLNSILRKYSSYSLTDDGKETLLSDSPRFMMQLGSYYLEKNFEPMQSMLNDIQHTWFYRNDKSVIYFSDLLSKAS